LFLSLTSAEYLISFVAASIFGFLTFKLLIKNNKNINALITICSLYRVLIGMYMLMQPCNF
jgi:undecaprenyl pyrophosphate phosphatase UppP